MTHYVHLQTPKIFFRTTSYHHWCPYCQCYREIHQDSEAQKILLYRLQPLHRAQYNTCTGCKRKSIMMKNAISQMWQSFFLH